MSDRDYIDPLALAVLEKAYDYLLPSHTQEWRDAKRPLLTPRASAVLAAVEEAMDVQCDNCMHVKNCDDPEIHMNCALARVRRAGRKGYE